jgi:hypothetical protein
MLYKKSIMSTIKIQNEHLGNHKSISNRYYLCPIESVTFIFYTLCFI